MGGFQESLITIVQKGYAVTVISSKPDKTNLSPLEFRATFS